VSIRVLLADDQAMVRAGFRMILESEADIEVVGEAANGEQATEATWRLRPTSC
jgi:DNA-binding NarL/FixJ family response regulator